MPQNIATTDQIDDLVDAWIAEGRFANRSEAFRAGIFALKEKLQAETFDPDYVTIVRDLDRHPGVQRSDNLRDWQDWQTMTLGNSPVEVADPDVSANAHRFYRAVAP